MPRSSTPVQIYRVVKSADNRFDKKDYKKALDGYKRALKMGPNDEIEAFCYFKIGICYHSNGKFSDAIASLEKSISIKKSYETYYYKGIIQLRLKKTIESADTFKQSLKLNNLSKQQEFLSYLNLGRINLIIGNKHKNAIKYLKKAITLNSKDATTLLLMAEAYKQQKDNLNAIKFFEIVLNIENNNKDAIIGIITILLDNKEEQKAISYLTKYMKSLKSPDPELLSIKGEIHYSLSDYENALINFRKASAINKESEKLLIRESRCLLSLKKFDEAVDLIKRFLTSNKDNFVANLFLAEIFATNKDISRASEILNDLLEKNSDIIQKAELSQAVANILLLNNEFDKAQSLFLNSVNLGIKSWTIYKQLALISIEKEEYDEAIDRLEISFQLARNPNELGQSYHLRCIMDYKRQRYDEVIKNSKKGVHQIKIKNEHYFLLKLLQAKSYLKQDNENKSRKIIEDIIKENSDIKLVIEQDSELKELL